MTDSRSKAQSKVREAAKLVGLAKAAEQVVKLCFSPHFGWSFKTGNGIPMGVSARQRRAIKLLAAHFDLYDDYTSAPKGN